MENKIKAIMMIGSYLDTIGFNNGMYEFNFNKGKINNFNDALAINNMIQTDFQFKGGFENFDIKNLFASDDSVMLLYTAYAVSEKKVDFNVYRKYFIQSYPHLKNENRRGTGIRTLESLSNLVKFSDTRIIFKYQSNGGGNGAAMRAAVIGIRFRNNIDELIKQAILAGKMTHTHPYGYLGSVAIAFFIKCALDDIIYFEWFHRFLKLYDKILEIAKISPEEEEYFNNFFIKIEEFFKKIKYYLDDDIPKGYYNIFRIEEILKDGFEPSFNGTNYEKFGATGLGVVIASLYFLFLSIKPKKKIFIKKGAMYDTKNLTIKDMEVDWRLLFTMSSLNFGDNDTIGMIVGNLYGAMFGFSNLPKIKFKDLEYYDEFEKISKKLANINK